jgi:hypothetical protein
MSDERVFTDNGHVLIAGITGAKDECGGKTALGNWWLDTWGAREFDLRLFVNPNGISSVRGERVESIDELADAMADGSRNINYVPDTSDWELAHQRLRDFVRELPKSMSKIVAHDEAPAYADQDSLLWFVRRAGQPDAFNTKSLVIAQSPGDIPTDVRKQCPTTIWIGPSSPANKHWFQRNSYGAHYEHIVEHHDPYEWTVMQGSRETDRSTYRPVPEEFA